MEKDKFELLFEQIEAFKNKYYLNMVFKGAIYFVSIFLSFFLIASLSEFFFEFSNFWRRSIFFIFILSNLILLIRYIGIPAYKLFGGKGRMTTEGAAKEIGDLIPEISDKLLNTIQLNDTNSSNYELILASLEKRTQSLMIHRFSSSIKFRSNRNKFRYFIVPVVVVMGIIIWDSNILLKSTERLLNYDSEFIKEAPFHFNVKNESLIVLEGESLEIDLELEGSEFPNLIKIISDHGRYSMSKYFSNSFSYKFKNISESFSFRFEGNGFSSKSYNIIVIPKPRINQMKVELQYPKYLKRENESVINNGDLILPEGTKLVYKLKLENINEYAFKFVDTIIKNGNALGSNIFEYKPRLSQEYSVSYKNDQLDSFKVKNFSLDIIKDQFPKIGVTEMVDSSSVFLRYFEGNAEDDYGLSTIKFYLRSVREGKIVFDTAMVIQSGIKYPKSRFYYNINLSNFNLKLEDDIEYYFVVWDNDGVNGSKSSKSKIFKYAVPSGSEYLEQVSKDRDKVEDDLQTALDKLKDYEKKVDKLKNNILNKEEKWKNKKMLDDVLKQRDELNSDLENILNQFNKNESFNEEFNKYDEEIQQKKEKIEELLENLMDEEMMKLLKEMQELLDDEKENVGEEQVEDLEEDLEKMKEEMDKTLEMLKRMDIEKGIEDNAKQLEDLAKKQEENAKKTEDKSENNEELKKEQERIQEEYNKIKENLEDLKKKNEELSKPMPLDPKMDKDANSDMEKSKEELDKKKNSKSSDSQEDAAEKMKDDAEALMEMLKSSSSKQNKVDMEALRDLLENVIRLSFEQEELLDYIKDVDVTDPKYLELVRTQRKIIDDNKLVKDSLSALMKRVPAISSAIGKEIRAIDANLSKSLMNLEERKKTVALSSEQYVMTSYNNIALLLSEALEQLQNQMKSKQPGSGSCDNPGGAGQKPSTGGMSMQQMKDALKKQLESMKKGKSPGGKKPGDSPGEGQGMMPGEGMSSKQIAKMAAEQGAIRKTLEKLRQKQNQDGSGNGNKLNDLIKELEEMEDDLVNKRFNRDIVKRQQDILTRLLEHDKAERERDFDEKRKSNSGKNNNAGNLNGFLEYKRKQEEQIELIKTLNPELRIYYKSKANEYFNTIEN